MKKQGMRRGDKASSEGMYCREALQIEAAGTAAPFRGSWKQEM